MAHVVVLGAGIGGMPMAYEMKELCRPDDAVAVINDNDRFRFDPSNPWVAINWRGREDITFPTRAAMDNREPEKTATRNAKCLADMGDTAPRSLPCGKSRRATSTGARRASGYIWRRWPLRILYPQDEEGLHRALV